jgi:hypothetical protein
MMPSIEALAPVDAANLTILPVNLLREQHEDRRRHFASARVRRHALDRQTSEWRSAEIHAGLDRWDALYDGGSDHLRYRR